MYVPKLFQGLFFPVPPTFVLRISFACRALFEPQRPSHSFDTTSKEGYTVYAAR